MTCRRLFTHEPAPTKSGRFRVSPPVKPCVKWCPAFYAGGFTFFIVFLLSFSLLRKSVLAASPRPLPAPTDALLPYMLAAFNRPDLVDLLKTLAPYKRLFSHVGQPEPNSGKPNRVDVIHEADPNAVVLMYRLMNDIPNGNIGGQFPFYKGGTLTRWNEWFEANLYEDIFLHAADPASLTITLIDNGKRIFWREDLR